MQAGPGSRLSFALLPAPPTATTRTSSQRPTPVANAAENVPRREVRTTRLLVSPEMVAVTRTCSRDLKCEPATINGAVCFSRRAGRLPEVEGVASADVPSASTTAIAANPAE